MHQRTWTNVRLKVVASLSQDDTALVGVELTILKAKDKKLKAGRLTRFAPANDSPRGGLLGWRCSSIKKVRNGGDQLRWRERLRQHDTVRDALGCPIVSVLAAHVNDGKVRIDFSGASGDIPAIDLVWPEIDVGDQRSIFSFGLVEQFQGIFARRSDYYLESSVSKAFFDDALNKMVVLNDQDNQQIFHASSPNRAPN